jgi:hypothetical protein
MGTVTSASAVVLSGAWQAFTGIWWETCTVVGAVFISLAVLAGLFFAWAIWDDRRHPLEVVVMGAMPGDPGAPLPVRKLAEAQPRHGCDDDTFVIDGLTTGLNELLRGENHG